jgi:hypothetical protein
MKRSLLLTFDYPPVISGIATVFFHVWKHFDHDRMLVLTSVCPMAKPSTVRRPSVRSDSPRRVAPLPGNSSRCS